MLFCLFWGCWFSCFWEGGSYEMGVAITSHQGIYYGLLLMIYFLSPFQILGIKSISFFLTILSYLWEIHKIWFGHTYILQFFSDLSLFPNHSTYYPFLPLLLKFTKAKLCCQNVLGSVAFSWNMVSLLRAVLLERKAVLCVPGFVHTVSVTVSTCALPCPQTVFSCTYSSPLFLTFFLPHLAQCQPNLGRRREISIYVQFRT